MLGAGKHRGARKGFPELLLEESDLDRTEERSKGIVNRGAESVRRVTLGKVQVLGAREKPDGAGITRASRMV